MLTGKQGGAAGGEPHPTAHNEDTERGQIKCIRRVLSWSHRHPREGWCGAEDGAILKPQGVG